MTGMEYSAASLMIGRGLVEEGMAVVKAMRERFDGEYRNPWNEFECGSNYARSMASYALLNSFSGFQFDLRQGMLGFNPVVKEYPFVSLWSVTGAWGKMEITRDSFSLRVLGGALSLQTSTSPLPPIGSNAGSETIALKHQ